MNNAQVQINVYTTEYKRSFNENLSNNFGSEFYRDTISSAICLSNTCHLIHLQYIYFID